MNMFKMEEEMKDKIYEKYIKKVKIEIKFKDNTEYITGKIFTRNQILKELK